MKREVTTPGAKSSDGAKAVSKRSRSEAQSDNVSVVPGQVGRRSAGSASSPSSFDVGHDAVYAIVGGSDGPGVLFPDADGGTE